MLSLVLALSLAQAEVAPPAPAVTDAPPAALVEPPPPPPVVVEPEFKPNTMGRKAGFFSEPRVSGGVLAARLGLGAAGALVGGGLGFGFGAVGLVLGVVFGAAPVILGALLAVASVATLTSIGAAAFGLDYGKDLADTVLIGLATGAVAVAAGLLAVVAAFPFSIPLIVLAVVAPLTTPLWVQLIKKPLPVDGPAAALTLARF
jgi:hypothetical protein